MKFLLSVTTALVSFSVFAASPVRIDGDVKIVRSANSFGSNNGKGANRVVNEEIHLEVSVKKAAEFSSKVELRWWLFQRGIGSTPNELKVADGGSQQIDVTSQQVAGFKSRAHNFHRQEAQSQPYWPSVKGGNRVVLGKNTLGVKFAGYGVQIIGGGQVLDSQFSSDDLAAHVGASAKTPGRVAQGGGKK